MKNNLKFIRANKGITQEQLASAAGISRPTLALIETEKTVPDGETIAKLVKALNMSADKIFGELGVPCEVKKDDYKMGIYNFNQDEILILLESLINEAKRRKKAFDKDHRYDEKNFEQSNSFYSMIAFWSKALFKMNWHYKEMISCGLMSDFNMVIDNLKKSHKDKKYIEELDMYIIDDGSVVSDEEEDFEECDEEEKEE